MSKLSQKRAGQEAKPGPHWLWVAVVLIVLATAWGVYYFLYYKKPVSTLGGFAQCLSAKSARMYGAWWCPHCAEQKELFGFAFQYVNYTECSPEGQKTMNEVCKQAGIKSYPTWQFADGSRTEGSQSLAILSEKTGCKLP